MTIPDGERQQMLSYLLERPLPAAPVLVGFGDSITAGNGASGVSKRWLNLVNASQQMAYELVNSGLSGTVLQNTVQNTVPTIGAAADNNGRDTYVSRVNAYNPARVLILYGLNDLRLNDPAFSVAAFQNDLTDVVNGIIANGTPANRITLGSPPHISDYTAGAPFDGGNATRHGAYRDAVTDVARATGAGYIDVYQWMLDHGGDTLVSSDGIHPNDAGHQAIAHAFLSVL